MHPFQVTDETKAMVLDNIVHVLNGFLRCSAFQNVVFCWVLHEQAIADAILSRLEGPFALKRVSLVCSREALESRLAPTCAPESGTNRSWCAARRGFRCTPGSTAKSST